MLAPKKSSPNIVPILIHATVDTDMLADSLYLDTFTVVEAAMPLPGQKTDTKREFAKGHIPKAVLVDIDECSRRKSKYPHMLASSLRFALKMSRLGIGNEPIIVYDRYGMFCAPRFWWMLNCYSHPECSVLDGGLPKWLKEKRPIESGFNPRPKRLLSFHPFKDKYLIAGLDFVQKAIPQKDHIIIDARSFERFKGEAPEPRKGLAKGHIPTSINIPYREVLTETDEFKPRDTLKALFKKKGVKHSHYITVSCGSGVTAAIVAMALEIADYDDVRVYDGSWAQWGDRTLKLPIEKGDEKRNEKGDEKGKGNGKGV